MAKIDDLATIDYLASHPDFLERHKDELTAKGVVIPAIPHQNTGPHQNNVIHITSKIAENARQEARAATKEKQTLMNVAAENMLHWQDLHLATLGLLACQDLQGLAQMVREELPLIFGLVSCDLVLLDHELTSEAKSLGFACLSAKEIESIMKDDVIYMGSVPDILQDIVLSSTKSMAVIRLPDQLPAPISSCCLLMGGKKNDSFSLDKGQSILFYLSEMIGVSLLRLTDSSKLHDH